MNIYIFIWSFMKRIFICIKKYFLFFLIKYIFFNSKWPFQANMRTRIPIADNSRGYSYGRSVVPAPGHPRLPNFSQWQGYSGPLEAGAGNYFYFRKSAVTFPQIHRATSVLRSSSGSSRGICFQSLPNIAPEQTPKKYSNISPCQTHRRFTRDS